MHSSLGDKKSWKDVAVEVSIFLAREEKWRSKEGSRGVVKRGDAVKWFGGLLSLIGSWRECMDLARRPTMVEEVDGDL